MNILDLVRLLWNRFLYIPKAKFQSEIVGRCNYGYGFSLEDALSESFHDKNITTEGEAFTHLNNIEFNANNAFLKFLGNSDPLYSVSSIKSCIIANIKQSYLYL